MNAQPIELATFGKNIKRLRENRGLSQEGLGNLVGVSHVTISMYENGKILPKVDKLDKLAAALHVPISSLFIEDTPGTLTYDEILLLSNYRKLNDEGKADARKHVSMMVASGIYAQ